MLGNDLLKFVALVVNLFNCLFILVLLWLFKSAIINRWDVIDWWFLLDDGLFLRNFTLLLADAGGHSIHWLERPMRLSFEQQSSLVYIVHPFDLVGILVPMQGLLVDHFVGDFLRLKNLLFKLVLSLHLQEAKVVHVPHTVHHFLQPSFILIWNLVEVGIVIGSRIIFIDDSKIILKISSLSKLRLAGVEVISSNVLLNLCFVVLIDIFLLPDPGVVFLNLTLLVLPFVLINEFMHDSIGICRGLFSLYKHVRLSEDLLWLLYLWVFLIQ